MKKLAKKFKFLNQLDLYVVLSLLFSALVSGVVVYFLIIPKINSISALNKDKDAQDAKLALVQANVAALNRIDKAKLASSSARLQNLIPEKPDQIRVFALMQLVTAKVGVSLEGISLNASNPVSNAAPVSSGSFLPAAGQKPSLANTPSADSYVVSLSIKSTYSQLQDLLIALRQTDRLSAVTNLTIAQITGQGDVSSTINLSTPLLAGQQVATADEKVSPLTPAEETEIAKLIENVVYSVKPATLPLSRKNPFSSY